MTSSGFPLGVLVGEVKEDFLCTLCKLVLRNPVQAVCGHRYCSYCFDQLAGRNDHKVEQAFCSACMDEGDVVSTRAWSQNIKVPDFAVRRELNRQNARCLTPGCGWSGTFAEYLQHKVVCTDVTGKFPTQAQPDGETHKPLDVKKEGPEMLEEPPDTKLEADHARGCCGQGRSTTGVLVEGRDDLAMIAGLGKRIEQLKIITATLEKEHRLYEEKLKDRHKKIEELELKESQIDARMVSVRHQIDMIEFYREEKGDGIGRWTAGEVRDFLASRNYSEGHSRILYIGNAGYKVEAELCLYQDDGEVYMGVRMYIHKHYYDAVLGWPFRRNINISVTGAGKSYSYNFTPNQNAPPFRKPTDTRNPPILLETPLSVGTLDTLAGGEGGGGAGEGGGGVCVTLTVDTSDNNDVQNVNFVIPQQEKGNPCPA